MASVLRYSDVLRAILQRFKNYAGAHSNQRRSIYINEAFLLLWKKCFSLNNITVPLFFFSSASPSSVVRCNWRNGLC